MDYLHMRPCQIREAIKNNTPVVLPLGVVEYHGEHLPLGVDAFVAIEAIRRVEEKHPEIIVLPPFYYGAASYAVAPPENNGTIQVESKDMMPVAEDIFRSLLRVGFRNIHAFIAHQTEQFDQGMPTDLAFRMAARNVEMEYLNKTVGDGWWGTEQFADYYSGANDPFSWILIHPVRFRTETKEKWPGDHAGKTETSEAMVICPECVNLDDIDDSLWFCRPAHQANVEWGDAVLNAAASDVEYALYGDYVTMATHTEEDLTKK